MKALVQDRFMSAEGTVRIDVVERPDVGDDEMLVRVRAASAKMYGWDLPAVVQRTSLEATNDTTSSSSP